ncbi:hypothetical protein UFOVP56_13 [uncultured Caudovirales phage]|uniref:Uncharacterized protein n=1 Tax=uncultured Caudovirales phage TaxID=2100421 RepID=A0A6J5TAB3_9CAUD|nr:hypothetical protein UFOVP56_13 [uncultured Caudovirales phage]
MFTGFPSTQTPAVQWWDFSKTGAGTKQIALANDCAPVQYFATGSSATTIVVTLPVNPVQGKTITFKNDQYVGNPQAIQITDILGKISVTLGQGGSITCCYIFENTLSGTSTVFSNWVIISGGTALVSRNQYAAIVGGNLNMASGVSSSVLGGDTNVSSSSQCVILGGQSNTSSGTNSAILGGQSNTSDGAQSAVIGGRNGTTRGIAGNIVSAASNQPIAATAGASQLAMIILGGTTSDATPKVITSNSSVAGTANQIILPDNSAYYFRGECIAGKTAAGDAKGWYIEGVIKRGAGASTTVLVGTPTVTSLYADVGANTWSVTATADVTNGGLAITITGQAATTIRWVAQIRTTEMTY